MTERIDTLVFVNNAISVHMARAALARDGVAFENVALFLGRKVHGAWFDRCGVVVPYPRKPSLTLLGQAHFLGYYRRAALRLRHLLASGAIRRAYIVNSDNLLSNHVLGWARGRDDVAVSVLVEGNMNFQDIQLRNRAAWRSWSKVALSRMLGLRWRTPQGHLSGAFEPSVSRVVSYTAENLMAPPDKVEVIPFVPVAPKVEPRPDTLLVAYTGLCQWMSEADFRPLAEGFVDWIRGQGFRRILVKPHPHYSAGLLEALMPQHEVVTDPRSLEDLAGEIDALTVASTNCTALVTLRMLRPDVRCVDYGSDYYCERAYFGDRSVQAIYRSAGVELVQVGQDAPAFA